MAVKKRAVEFFRVSSKRQKDEGFSLEAQSRLAKDYYKKESLKTVRTWSISESASKEKDRNSLAMLYFYYKENEIKNIIDASVITSNIHKLKEYMGYSYLSLNEMTLPPVPLECLFGEENYIMHLENSSFSNEFIEKSNIFRKAWDEKTTVNASNHLLDVA